MRQSSALSLEAELSHKNRSSVKRWSITLALRGAILVALKELSIVFSTKEVSDIRGAVRSSTPVKSGGVGQKYAGKWVGVGLGLG